MFFKSWIKKLLCTLDAVGQRRPRSPLARARQPRLVLEILESRLAPASLTVNSLADNITDTSVLTLREAIELVNNGGQAIPPGAWAAQISGAFGSDDTIQFDPTLFDGTQQTIILGGSELLLSRDMTITGPGASKLAVSGNQASSVFDIAGDTTVGISGLTIENGNAAYGGGIVNDGTLTLSDSIVSGNVVTDIGGGIYNSGTATISGTTLSGNRSIGNYGTGGGAITNDGELTLIGSVLSDNSARYEGGGIQNYATMTITGSTLSGNSAQFGGGIYNRYDTLTVSDSTLSGNSATYGGGIDNDGATLNVRGSILSGNSATYGGGIANPFGAVTVSKSTLSDNRAKNGGGGIYNDGKLTVSSSTLSRNSTSGGGGGFYNYPHGNLTISGSTLSQNSAGGDGGGIYAQSTVTVIDSTISGNSAGGSGGGISGNFLTIRNSAISGNSAGGYGGGIESHGNVTVVNSTISGNSAGYSGGGGGIHAWHVYMTISSSTISNNVAGYGGGILADGPLTLSNSIVAGNSDDLGAPDLGLFSDLTLINSLIGDSGDTGLELSPAGAADADGNFIGSPDAPIDPLLGPLADHGGPTQTMALLPGSPAIDHGANPDNLAADQRGLPYVRTFGSQTDMGAYEVNSVAMAETTTAVASPNSPTIVGQAVTFTATVTVVAPGAGNPTGTVTFVDNGATLGSGTLNAIGEAIFTADALSVGAHNITASYGGDTSFVGSSGAMTQQVSTPLADLQVTISPVTPNPVLEGQDFSYTITVTNIGPETATNVRVGYAAEGGKKLVFAQDTLGNGEQAFFLVPQTAGTAGVYSDTFFAFADQEDPNPDNDIATVEYEVIAPQADLQVTISPVTPNPVLEGQDFSYTITVTNIGPETATNVRVGYAAEGGKKLVFAQDTLGNGEQAFFLVPQTAGTAGVYSDTFFAFADQEDPNPDNDIATVEYEVIAPQADLQVTISPVTPNPILEGQGFFYTITVANVGPQTASNVVVQDAQKNVIFAPGTLQNGGQVSFTVKKTAGAAGAYGDTIFAHADQNDPNLADNTVIVKYQVSAVTSESLQKVINAALTDVPIILQVDAATAGAVIAAVNGIAPPNPCRLVLNMAAGTYAGFMASPPAGMILKLAGTGTATKIVGQSPALTVTSGTVIVSGVTFTNATAAPTILVTGGSLTLRDNVIQETTGGNHAAVQISGGTLDLGTTASPGGNTLNVNGAGDLIRNASAGAVSAIGNAFQVDGSVLTSSFRVEDRIVHALDLLGMGLVTWTANNVYVTSASGSVQRGIDSVAVGGIVNVETANHTLFNIGAKLVTVLYQDGLSLGLEADPLYAGQVMLHVVGTAGDDTIRIKSADNDPDSIRVRIKDMDLGHLKLRGAFGMAIGRIVVSGLAGNDDIKVDDDIAISAWLSGGAGDDRLQGGAGNDVLLGGVGDDLLTGGDGRDLLIGGTGADRLRGVAGDDVLVAGTTAHDANDIALWSIMQEWTSGHGYNARVANMEAGAGLTGGFRLNGNDGALQTVFNDNDVDILTGNQGMDWFLANRVADNGGALDIVTDQASNEVWSDTDF